ncbi:nucleophile aminohydrolase [Ostreococcus tauri]|uniref:Proteasome subunit beta n=1 Tax=Ostreococcus tauri TaxID=70448 RepID=A0A1Y5I453_OSTTA|nr:nucleophile aminohydrolase [Ostreococcus tauri]
MTVASGSSGFQFERSADGTALQEVKAAKKTGTTICGIVFSSGVVLGADTRSTNGETVADKNCAKIHFLASNMYCCGAGTAADTESVTGTISSELLLHRSLCNRPTRVLTALTLLKERLYKYQGHIGAALVLGGVDAQGPHIFSVYPHGSSDVLPYATMGSGSLAAMSVLESEYREGLDEQAAKELVTRAIRAGIFNDLGSGSNVDLCVITNDGVQELRNYEIHNTRACNVQSVLMSFKDVELHENNANTATSAMRLQKPAVFSVDENDRL